MRIDQPMLKLPINFCADTLAREVAALPDTAWTEHPQKFDGNIAVALVSPGGEINDDWTGPMAPTSNLKQMPYTSQIMGALGATWGRSRLMGLKPGAVVPEHVDVHYYWRTHLRLHIPVATNPDVKFHCADETFHLGAGECWLLDSFYRHSVENCGDDLRIHLVLDTVGGGWLWDLIDCAVQGGVDDAFLAPSDAPTPPLQFEQFNVPTIMSPWELGAHLDYLCSWVDGEPRMPALQRMLDRLRMAWAGTWARYGDAAEGVPFYMQHLRQADQALSAADTPPVMMRNQWSFVDSVRRYVLSMAVSPKMLGRGR